MAAGTAFEKTTFLDVELRVVNFSLHVAARRDANTISCDCPVANLTKNFDMIGDDRAEHMRASVDQQPLASDLAIYHATQIHIGGDGDQTLDPRIGRYRKRRVIGRDHRFRCHLRHLRSQEKSAVIEQAPLTHCSVP